MMNNTISIITLSKQAGHILRHLSWLPEKVFSIVKGFPYHSARLFAIGMDYVLDSYDYRLTQKDKGPVEFLSSSSYGRSLNVKEFAGFVPAGTLGLLIKLGSIAEQALLNKEDLKIVLRPSNHSIQVAFDQYEKDKNLLPNLQDGKNRYFDKPSIGEIVSSLSHAIDAGASNLAGLKECYLVARYYERIYNRAYPNDYKLFRDINNLNYELTPFPDTVEIKKGDRFIFDGVPYEKHWPDVLLRDGKYSIVHHIQEPKYHMITAPNVSNFEDIRVAVLEHTEIGIFFLCKRKGKWGVVYSERSKYLFTLLVPYDYDTPEDAANEIRSFFDNDCDTRLVAWDEFKGLFLSSYDNPNTNN